MLKALESVKPGDLIVVDWLDASRGRIETMRELREGGAAGAVIDSPVKSYGVFLGLFGKRSKHIVLMASLWVFTATADYGQVDTTIIPLGIVENIHVIQSGALDVERVRLCQTAFMNGRCYRYRQRFEVNERV